MKFLTRTAIVMTAPAGLVLTMMALSACNGSTSADTSSRDNGARAVASVKSVAPPKCSDCGTISNIEQIKEKGSGSGVGAVAGAVAGAVVGHQIGDGRGKDVATAAGAIGGGFAGNEIEKRAKSTTYYRVTVAMEDGTSRTVDVDALNGLSTGSKVKVVGSNLQSVG